MKFRISQTYDSRTNRPIFCVIGTDNGYIGKWHNALYAACRELRTLGEEEELPLYGWSREDTALWGNQYKAVLVQDGGVPRLFVFRCQGQDGSRVAGGLHRIHLEYWDGDITKAAKAVLARGSARFACNSHIVTDWKENVGQYDHVPEREQYVLDYLETVWRMLPDSAITESQYFLVQGGEA
jgi:hypothetical protein